jgi:hypothetical protein
MSEGNGWDWIDTAEAEYRFEYSDEPRCPMLGLAVAAPIGIMFWVLLAWLIWRMMA